MLCAACGKEGAPKACARCHIMWYCGPECQRAHWQEHKAVCLKKNIVDIEDLKMPGKLPRHRADLLQARVDAKQCSCPRCAKTCRGIPGVYDPAHVLLLRQAWLSQKKNPKGFWNQFVNDYWLGTGGAPDTQYLRPPAGDDEPGQRVGFFSVGTCANLTPEGCRLPRHEMPLGCVTTLPCDPANISYDKSCAPSIWGGELGKRAMKLFWERG